MEDNVTNFLAFFVVSSVYCQILGSSSQLIIFGPCNSNNSLNKTFHSFFPPHKFRAEITSSICHNMQGIYMLVHQRSLIFFKNGFGILQWKNFFNLLDVFILLVHIYTYIHCCICICLQNLNTLSCVYMCGVCKDLRIFLCTYLGLLVRSVQLPLFTVF